MDWAAVINNPFLKDLPFKIELNKWGQILMSPASNNHGRHQFNVGDKIKTGKKGHGQVIMECSIQTDQGVKVADVAWKDGQPLPWSEAAGSLLTNDAEPRMPPFLFENTGQREKSLLSLWAYCGIR